MKFGLRLLVAFVAVSPAAFASAQTGISVTINGDAVQFQGTGPQMVNGRVLVPLRGVFEKLGASVRWLPERQEVIATRGNNTVDLIIGNTNASVNGQGVKLDVPAEIVGGSTLVPIRFVSEAIGAEVKWNDAEKIVIITAGDDQSSAAAPAPPEPEPAPVEDTTSDGPVRMARIARIDGAVSWRPGDDVDWSDAGWNLPLREGAEIWVNPGARAEIQFDDGSFLRLGNGALATFHTMFSDSRGEFTEIKLNTGTASLQLTSNLSSYQVDTPLASVTSAGVSNLRVDATNGLRAIVWDGQANVQGIAGQMTVGGGEYLRLANAQSNYTVFPAPGRDSWDDFCDGRNEATRHPSRYLPSSIALVAGDLDSYGDWIRDPQYGYCWHPNMPDPNWAPYHDGHWVWVSPFGWTWCGNEPWGWAPYHYGTWFASPRGWLWRPGPAQQCWSPAVVHFSTNNGAIAWCPLAPAEVHYPPALSIHFGSGNWSVNFSIGGAASYYPDGPNSCSPRPWNNREVNRTTNVYNVTRVTNITNVYVNNVFVPRNARVPGGATVTNTSGFGGRGSFARGSASTVDIFTKGKGFGAPSGGTRFAGPTNVQPTATSFSPARQLTKARPDPRIFTRPVVRAPLTPRTSAYSKPMPTAQIVPTVSRPAPRPPVIKPNINPIPAPKVPPVKGNRKGGRVAPAPTPPTAVVPVPAPVIKPSAPVKGQKGRKQRGGRQGNVTPDPTTISPVAPTVPVAPAPPAQEKPLAPRRGGRDRVVPTDPTTPSSETKPAAPIKVAPAPKSDKKAPIKPAGKKKSDKKKGD